MKWDSEIEFIVKKYSLQNSLEYNGKGKSGSVLGRILSERADLREQAKSLKKLVEEEVELQLERELRNLLEKPLVLSMKVLR